MRPFTAVQKHPLLPALLVALTAVVSWPANAASISGIVQTGGTASSEPLANVRVTLFEATTAEPTLLGQATTDSLGHFTIESPTDHSPSIYYLNAKIGEGVKFITVLGPNLPSSAVINELTTVAACYSMAQFYRAGEISGDAFALQIAAGMNDNLVLSGSG
jgi:hypothetical protein